MIGLFGLLVLVVAVIAGRESSFILVLQFVPRREDGGVEFDAAVECAWAGTHGLAQQFSHMFKSQYWQSV